MQNKTWKLKLTLLLVSSLTIISVITISPALPQMTIAFSDVKNAAFLVKLVLTIPALIIAIFSPITGRLIDRYGRLRILWFSLALYAISGSAGYYLNNIYHILISRAVLGLSVGMSMTIVITLIADYFEGMERQKFVGLQIAFMSLGGILFIGLGGILADVGWRYPFLIYLFSLMVLPLAIMFLEEPAIVQKNKLVNKHMKAPGIIWMLFFNTMFMWIVFFLIPVQIPFHLKSLGVEKNSLIGAAIATSTAFSAVSSFSYSKIKSRFSFLSVFAIGYFLMAAGFVCISISHSYLLVVIAMILSGLGMGMMIPNTNMWVMKIVPPEIRGKEIGKLTTFWFFGQFLSPIIIFPVLKTLSLSSTFMLAAGFLLLMSLGFLAFHFTKAGRSVIQ
ncbi:MAG TPA: MFS transporter [Chitinophagaceae bacterium]|nr:MFS transporter [Chitinophagaceae bacterium]